MSRRGSVRIVTDSTSDLPPQVASDLGIAMVPLYVHFGSEAYRDGVDMGTEEFYRRLVTDPTPPTTSTPPVGAFVDCFNNLAQETGEILCICISSKVSATYNAARQAREIVGERCRVEVIDSQLALMTLGLVVIALAKAAREGVGLAELVEMAGCLAPKSHLRLTFDTLEYLRRGGRIGKAQSLLGSLLKINPILTLRDGEVYPAARVRSRGKAVEYLVRFGAGFPHIREMAVEHANTPEEATGLVERLSNFYPKERIYLSTVSPVIGAHVGPHVLGVSVLEGDEK